MADKKDGTRMNRSFHWEVKRPLLVVVNSCVRTTRFFRVELTVAMSFAWSGTEMIYLSRHPFVRKAVESSSAIEYEHTS